MSRPDNIQIETYALQEKGLTAMHLLLLRVNTQAVNQSQELELLLSSQVQGKNQDSVPLVYDLQKVQAPGNTGL